jgi:hypothetical protein
MVLTIGQDANKKGTDGYFFYNPENYDANAVLKQAYDKAAETATAENPVKINVESGQYWINDHIYPASHVYLQGEVGVVFKLAPDLKCACMYGKDYMKNDNEPYAHWGFHGANGHLQSAMFNIWKVTDVRLSTFTLDGSYDDLYDGKMCDGNGNVVSGGEARGKSEFTQMNIWQSSNIKIDHVELTRGANDGIGCYSSNDIDVGYCRFDMVGHDGIQVASGCQRVKIHHNFCRIRTNVAFRISYGSENCEIFCNEVTRGEGGGSAVEFVQACPGTLVHNNYFHDITNGGYGAIGYKGLTVSGPGHKYFNNIIINCAYAANDCPAGYEACNNVALNCGSLWGGSPAKDTPNVTQDSEYTAEKYGENGQCNTYWKIKSGSLAGQIVGIDPKYGSDIQIPEPAQVNPHIIELLQTNPCILIQCENSETQQKLFDALNATGLIENGKMEITQV